MSLSPNIFELFLMFHKRTCPNNIAFASMHFLSWQLKHTHTHTQKPKNKCKLHSNSQNPQRQRVYISQIDTRVQGLRKKKYLK